MKLNYAMLVPVVSLTSLACSCGSDSSQPQLDAGTPPDASVLDSGEAGGDASVADADTDGGSGDSSTPPYPPAAFSTRLEHVGYSELYVRNAPAIPCFSATWVGELAPGANLGTGPRTKTAAFGYRLDSKTGLPCGSAFNTDVLTITDLATTERVLDIAAPLADFRVAISGKDATWAANVFLGGAIGNSNGVGGWAREHIEEIGPNKFFVATDSAKVNTLVNFGASAGTVSPGTLSFVEQQSGWIRSLPGPGAAPAVAIDKIVSVSSSGDWIVVGRLAGPTFDFLAPNPPDGQAAGSGYFMAKFKDNGQLVTQWVKVFGGAPQEAIGAVDRPGTGARASAETSSEVIFTSVFEGTMSFEGTTLTAPSNAPAIAVAIYSDNSGALTFKNAFAFPKGPASKGKLSRPRVRRLAFDKYLLVDTVWDSIDVGGVKALAKQGADVAMVGFDGKGVGQWARVYGGPGDDESYEATVSSGTAVFWTGHSASSIEFGNGPLTTTAVDGEAWATRIDL